jgi:hypothetical protein
VVNSSSVIPSKRLGFVDGFEDFRLLFTMAGGLGEEGIGVEFFIVIVDIDGRSGDDEGDETTFIIGEMIVFEEEGGVSVCDREFSALVLICSGDFCSFSNVDIVSRLSDSLSFARNTSATSSEPNEFFKALNRIKIDELFEN